jgi:hypothetical protein
VKQEPRIKGVLKRKAIIPREQQGQGTPHTSSPPADPPHVTTEQPKGEVSLSSQFSKLLPFLEWKIAALVEISDGFSEFNFLPSVFF